MDSVNEEDKYKTPIRTSNQIRNSNLLQISPIFKKSKMMRGENSNSHMSIRKHLFYNENFPNQER